MWNRDTPAGGASRAVQRDKARAAAGHISDPRAQHETLVRRVEVLHCVIQGRKFAGIGGKQTIHEDVRHRRRCADRQFPQLDCCRSAGDLHSPVANDDASSKHGEDVGMISDRSSRRAGGALPGRRASHGSARQRRTADASRDDPASRRKTGSSRSTTPASTTHRRAAGVEPRTSAHSAHASRGVLPRYS